MSLIVVVTGANRGIGLSFCKHYHELGATVYAVCRTASLELNKLGVRVVEGVDISDPSSMPALKNALTGESIDILINNAGILRGEMLGDIDFESIQSQFEVNALGPLRVTEALLDRLHSGSKIAMITSRMGSIEDNSSGGRYGYRMSKCALNIAAVSLAKDLRSSEIAVGIYHPGLVGTEMIGGHGDITPDVAAQRLIDRISELDVTTSGQFRHSNGERLPW